MSEKTKEIKSFRKGDWISHLHHGVGQVEGKEKKSLGGESQEYYKVRTRNGTYWIPTDNLDPDRIRVVPEALDEDVRDRARAGEVTDVGRRPPVVLSVARQYRRKDTPTLLRAFRTVLRSVPEARLRVVGDGPELPASRRLASSLGLGDSVTFTGALPTTAALDAEYRRARVFCLPSRQEGFGIVFLEAMAYGLPIAAARAAAVPEVAPDGETSLLVEPGDADALADVLVRLSTDDGLARRLGARGPVRADRFTWRATARAFIDGLP